jgi:methyl-accepting chemotaxis protein-1 (serine sensor receptor)
MARLFAGTSIRFKVMVASAAMLCCIAGLSSIAVQDLVSVGTAAADIEDNHLPSVQLLGDMAYQTTHLRIVEGDFALTTDPTARAREGAAMAEARDQAGRSFKTYAALARTGAERRMANDTRHR